MFFLYLAKNRGIAIPVDLDSQVNTLFSKSQMVMKHTHHWLKAGRSRKDSTLAVSRDYRSIIEGLQVKNKPNCFKASIHIPSKLKSASKISHVLEILAVTNI